MRRSLPEHVNSVEVTGNKTLALTDAGTAQFVSADATLSLPDTTAVPVGTEFTIVNDGQGDTDGTITINVSPVSGDKIQGGPTGTATDNKDLINTNGRGGLDFLRVRSDGVAGYVVVDFNGAWPREA